MIGGGVIAAGDLLLEPARRVVLAARAVAVARRRADRARALRRGVGDARRGRAGARGGWADERPARRLPDADRQPRGRHAARAQRAARRRRRRLRGHAPHPRAARPLRRAARRRVSYHEHNERERSAELVRRMQAGETVALVSDAGMPLVSDPGFVLVQACVAAGLAVEVLPGPSRGARRRSWSAGCRRSAGASPGSCRASAASSRRCSAPAARRRWWPSSRRAASARRWRRWPRSTPTRPVAVCRELTKLHEEVVRGTRGGAGRALRRRGASGEVVARGRRRADRRSPDLGAGARRGAPPRRRGRQGAHRGRASSPSSPASAPTRSTTRCSEDEEGPRPPMRSRLPKTRDTPTRASSPSQDDWFRQP